MEGKGNFTKKISQIFSGLKNGPSSAFQLRFKDRQYAANILAATLQDRIGKDLKQRENIIILGIPRGGVIVANVVAKKLKIKDFDIVIPRKLTDIDNKEQAIGAIMEDGTSYLDEEVVSDLQITPEYLELERENQIKEIKRRISLYRNFNYSYSDIINNKTVILIDDGAASGATVIVAARWLKKNFKIQKLIIALPVIPRRSIALLEKECDLVVSVTTPSKYFHTVGQYYKSFNPVEDVQVIDILNSRVKENNNASNA